MTSIRPNVDRRVLRTRRTLQQALLSLMLRKGYDAVTVEDICQEANVGRSTFYVHFRGKEDLKRSGLDEHLRKALRERRRLAGKNAQGDFGFALDIFEHAREHLDLFRALTRKGGTATSLAMVRQIVVDELREDMRAGSRISGQEELTLQFLAGGFMSMLTAWLNSGARTPPADVAALFASLAREGMSG